MFWYPVEGHPEICQAPGHAGRLRPPQGLSRLVHAVGRGWDLRLRSSSRSFRRATGRGQMIEKFKFYEKHGVQEYYIYDPYEVILTGYLTD